MYKHIRKIFSVFALVMIVVFSLRLSADVWTPVNWGMMAISAVACLLVFRCFVQIFNYSYALACIANGALIAVTGQTLAGYLVCGLMVLYGLRLLLFTIRRTGSESYAPRVDNIRNEDVKMPAFVKVLLWVQCTFLYTFHLFGAWIVAQRGVLDASVIAGALIIAAGLLIEALADAQKQSAKAANPDTFVTSGLFARWRHPNYIGEVMVQCGLIVVGVGAVSATWGSLAAVIVAPLYIVLLMLAECLRADDSMELRYGDQQSFRDYKDRSGAILPRLQA